MKANVGVEVLIQPRAIFSKVILYVPLLGLTYSSGTSRRGTVVLRRLFFRGEPAQIGNRSFSNMHTLGVDDSAPSISLALLVVPSPPLFPKKIKRGNRN